MPNVILEDAVKALTPESRTPKPSSRLEAGEPTAGSSSVPAAGQDAWFDDLVRDHYRLVFAIAYRVLGSAADAEDAVQNAFLKAFRARDTVRDAKASVGWLARIARNAALDVGRGRGRRKRLQNEATQQAEDAAKRRVARQPEAVHEDERERLREAVRALPDAEALVVTLRFLEGRSPAEIAEQLGEKPGTVRVRLHRALKRLRVSLGERGQPS